MAKTQQECLASPSVSRLSCLQAAISLCSPRLSTLSLAFTGLNGYRLSACRGPDSVYGELASLEEYVTVLKRSHRLSPDSLFVDLGSGLGKPAVLAASLFNVKRSIGIECVPKLCETAKEVCSLLEKTALVRPGQLSFVQSNIHRCRGLWQEADVVYVGCLTWTRRSLRRLRAGLRGLKTGAEVFTSTTLPSKDFKLREVMEARGDWGRTRVLLYAKQ